MQNLYQSNVKIIDTRQTALLTVTMSYFLIGNAVKEQAVK